MKRYQNKFFASVLCVVLIVAMALSMTACTTNIPNADAGAAVEKTFTFEVVDKDGNSETFTITSAKKTVGEALIDEGLIVGENGPYGLYVTEVNGIVADYDVDQTYWAFYVDGGYAASGVDMTEIMDGAAYTFKVEK